MGPSMKCTERIPRVPPTHPMDMPNTRVRKTSEWQIKKDDCLPKFRSSMLMLQKIGKVERKLGVVLSIYATNFDLYAVVSQDRNIVVKDCGYIKLRNCSVTTDKNSLILEIVQQNYEGIPLRFKMQKREHLEQITQLLHLNTEEDIFSDNMPLSSSPSSSMVYPGLRKLMMRSSSQGTRSPRVSPTAKRKLSMPVLAEDEEREQMEEQNEIILEEQDSCESEE